MKIVQRCLEIEKYDILICYKNLDILYFSPTQLTGSFDTIFLFLLVQGILDTHFRTSAVF